MQILHALRHLLRSAPLAVVSIPNYLTISEHDFVAMELPVCGTPNWEHHPAGHNQVQPYPRFTALQCAEFSSHSRPLPADRQPCQVVVAIGVLLPSWRTHPVSNQRRQQACRQLPWLCSHSADLPAAPRQRTVQGPGAMQITRAPAAAPCR